MSEITPCPSCESPSAEGKRCEECRKAFLSPYGAAYELPIRKRELREAAAELKRVTEDLVTATTALEAAQAQIAALKVEVAGMMKERDEARDREDFYRDDRDYWKGHCDRMSREQGTIMDARLACETMRKERDASLADLSQARAERDEHKTFRDVNEGLLKDAEALCRRLFTSRDAAIARAEAAEARVRELEARNGR